MNTFTKLTALAIFSIPYLAIADAQANNINQFDVCLEELTTSGIEVKDAQAGCADALYPKDLSYCVKTIATSTTIAPLDALKNCYQVRRPIEMGNCVADIQQKVISPLTKPAAPEGAETPTTIVDNDAVIMMALNTCRASLLPDRHSECVVAVARTPEVSDATEAMKTCIRAEDFPRQLYRNN